MARQALILAVAVVLAGCGGGGGRVTGPLAEACIRADRAAASPALCSCVQQVANQSLTAAEQRRAAAFFEDPQRAQDTRQSDRPSDENFWQRYRAFAERAESSCG